MYSSFGSGNGGGNKGGGAFGTRGRGNKKNNKNKGRNNRNNSHNSHGSYNNRGGGHNSYGSGSGAGSGHGKPSRADPCRFFVQGKCNKKSCGFPHRVQIMKELNGTAGTTVSAIAVYAAKATIFFAEGNQIRGLNGEFNVQHSFEVPGTVGCLLMDGDFLYCGYEAVATGATKVPVGMLKCWNFALSAEYQFVGSATQPYCHKSAVTDIKSAPQASGSPIIFSSSRDGTIRMYQFNGPANRFEGFGLFDGHVRDVTSVLWGGRFLYSSSSDQTIKVWDPASQRCVHTLTEGHTKDVMALRSFKMPGVEAPFMLSVGLDNAILVWSLATPEKPTPVAEVSSGPTKGPGIATAYVLTFAAAAGAAASTPILVLGLADGSVAFKALITGLPDLGSCHFSKNGGHNKAVVALMQGPHTLFFSGACDGKFVAWQYVPGV